MEPAPEFHLSEPREIENYVVRWPDGEETYPKGWEYEAELGDRSYRMRHLVGTREVGGEERPRTLTMVGETVTVEGVGTDDYSESRALASLVRRKYGDRRNVRQRRLVPRVYDQFDVIWMRDEVSSKGSRYAFGVKIREDDLEKWTLHALIRWGVFGGDGEVSTYDFRDPAELRRVYEGDFPKDPQIAEWRTRYQAVFEGIRAAGREEFCSPEFQKTLWDDCAVAGLGQGEYPHVGGLERFPELAELAGSFRYQPLPEDAVGRRREYERMVEQLVAKVRQIGHPKTPHGKIYRYMAALFPHDFCSIAVRWKLGGVAKALIGETIPKGAVNRHGVVMDALARALGPVSDDPEALAARASFPWWLYDNYIAAGEDDVDDGDDGDGEVADWSRPSFPELWHGFEGLSYVFPRSLVASLHSALHAHPRKHFVLLSGLSGTGKTQLARIYANLYCGIEPFEENGQVCLVPVQPDWTDPSGLLGYVNPLREKVTYERTECLSFLHEAQEHPDLPYFLILDEMNLARPEYYFAPFLSAMETGEPLVVHSQGGPIDLVEPKIRWPENLYIIGTVNMDETTHAFSDKVLDRAFTIELWDVDLEQLRQKLTGYPKDLLAHAFEVMDKVHAILEPIRMHVGYRTIREFVQYLRENEREEKPLVSRSHATDAALYMKVLPRLRGEDSGPLREALDQLEEMSRAREFTTCANKLAQMREELRSTGIMKFWR